MLADRARLEAYRRELMEGVPSTAADSASEYSTGEEYAMSSGEETTPSEIARDREWLLRRASPPACASPAPVLELFLAYP